MAYSIRVNEVRRALQPMLGTQLVTQTALCDHAADMLRRHQPGKESPQQLQPVFTFSNVLLVGFDVGAGVAVASGVGVAGFRVISG